MRRNKICDVPSLLRENETLVKELRVAREASALTAELVARQFANLDIILKELDQRARNEKALRKDMTLARKAAEDASTAKSEFLANMSHEIRTPMNGIIGMAELVLGTELSGTQRNYLEMLRSSANRLLRVINDILDFSRVESGKLELDPVTFDLRETLENAILMFVPTAKKKGLYVATSIDPAVPRQIHADSNRLLQIIINLVNNAIKFTHEGSIQVQVDTLGPPEQNTYPIRFSVVDTGIGIAAEKQDQIFDSFRQADSSITRQYGGTGLGLAISCQLAELMGSKIELTSEKGKGSTFWFDCLLPARASHEGEKQAVVTQKIETTFTPEDLQDVAILLAEDELINQALVLALLEQMGLNVTAVTNGLEAVNEVAAHSYQLILMDLQMPEVDGFEATRQIRLFEGEKSRIPIIALTAHAMEKDREKCLRAGMDDYLSKPIDSDQLNNMLCKYLLSSVTQHTQSDQ